MWTLICVSACMHYQVKNQMQYIQLKQSRNTMRRLTINSNVTCNIIQNVLNHINIKLKLKFPTSIQYTLIQ